MIRVKKQVRPAARAARQTGMNPAPRKPVGGRGCTITRMRDLLSLADPCVLMPPCLSADLGGRHGAVAGQDQRENLRDRRRAEDGGEGAGGPQRHCEDLVLRRGQIRAERVRQGGRKDRHLDSRVTAVGADQGRAPSEAGGPAARCPGLAQRGRRSGVVSPGLS